MQVATKTGFTVLKILRKREEIAHKEQFLLLSTIFCYLKDASTVFSFFPGFLKKMFQFGYMADNLRQDIVI